MAQLSLVISGIRVRRIISQLSYPELVLNGIVPNLEGTIPKLPLKKYPPWVYAQSKSNPNFFCEFGLFIEEVIYTAIVGGKMDYAELWSRIAQSTPPAELQSSANFFGGLIGWVRPFFTGHQVEHGREFRHGEVEGHPDLFCDNFTVGNQKQTWIIDVKTTTGFAKMAHESYLQILAYSALARANGFVNNAVGLLLPIQRQIFWFDLTNWNHGHYLEVLKQEAEWVKDDTSMLEPEYLLSHLEEDAVIMPTLIGTWGRRLLSGISGAHVSKEELLEMSQGSRGRPIQVFLANPRDYGQISDAETTRMIGDVVPGTQLFVHASYFVNLSSPEHSPWSIQRLRQELAGCRKLKGRGVVVHMGTYGSNTISSALDRMEEGIRQALEAASPDCPIVLETPAGEGTDLCASIEQLMLFYLRFKGDPRVRICVDSAHSHGAGYKTTWYLHQWLTRWPDSIVLVHFNDSKVCRGSRVDRHYFPGLGHIGYKEMWALHQMCVAKGIPMVRE